MLESLDWSLILSFGTVLGSGGAAWGAGIVALASVRKNVEANSTEIKKARTANVVVQSQVVDRLARIETKLDLLMKHRRLQ